MLSVFPDYRNLWKSTVLGKPLQGDLLFTVDQTTPDGTLIYLRVPFEVWRHSQHLYEQAWDGVLSWQHQHQGRHLRLTPVGLDWSMHEIDAQTEFELWLPEAGQPSLPVTARELSDFIETLERDGYDLEFPAILPDIRRWRRHLSWRERGRLLRLYLRKRIMMAGPIRWSRS